MSTQAEIAFNEDFGTVVMVNCPHLGHSRLVPWLMKLLIPIAPHKVQRANTTCPNVCRAGGLPRRRPTPRRLEMPPHRVVTGTYYLYIQGKIPEEEVSRIILRKPEILSVFDPNSLRSGYDRSGHSTALGSPASQVERTFPFRSIS